MHKTRRLSVRLSFCFKFFNKNLFFRVQGDDSRKYFRFAIDDVFDVENIAELLRDAVHFICKTKNWIWTNWKLIFLAVAYDRGDPVLVYSDRGVSRSAAVIVAFISFKMRLTCQVNSLEFFSSRNRLIWFFSKRWNMSNDIEMCARNNRFSVASIN